jgi:hypothetical protein
MIGLGATLSLLGENDEAKQILLRMMQVSQKVLAPEHPIALAARGNLAMVLINRTEMMSSRRCIHRYYCSGGRCMVPSILTR